MRDEGKPDEAVALAPHDAHIYGRKFVIIFPIKDDLPGLSIPARQSCLALPPLAGLFRDAHENDHAVVGGNCARIKGADHFQVWLRGLEISRPQQTLIE